MNQVVGVTDLRGRVVRCDASIARLAADLKTVFDSVRNLGQQQLEQNSRLVESVHALDARVSFLNSSRHFSLSASLKIPYKNQIISCIDFTVALMLASKEVPM